MCNSKTMKGYSHQHADLFACRGFFENQKGSGASSQATCFVDFFNKSFSFVRLQKLAKFRFQTVFTSQVIY